MMPKDLAELKSQTRGQAAGIVQGDKAAIFMRDFYNIMLPTLRSSVANCQELLKDEPEALEVLSDISGTVACLFSQGQTGDFRNFTAIGELLDRVKSAGEPGRKAWSLFTHSVFHVLMMVPILFPEFGSTLPDDPDHPATVQHIGLVGLIAGMPDDVRRKIIAHLLECGCLSTRLDYSALKRSREDAWQAVQAVVAKTRKAAENEQV